MLVKDLSHSSRGKACKIVTGFPWATQSKIGVVCFFLLFSP